MPELQPESEEKTESEDQTTNILVSELLLADNSTMIAYSAEKIQRIVDVFSNASSKLYIFHESCQFDSRVISYNKIYVANIPRFCKKQTQCEAN